MLAQNFKTPTELRITDAEFDALFKVLGILERGEIAHAEPPLGFKNASVTEPVYFNMDSWSRPNAECGTVCCIGGLAEAVGRLPFGALQSLRCPQLHGLLYPELKFRPDKITPAQAAIALRTFLRTGEPRWAEAIAG